MDDCVGLLYGKYGAHGSRTMTLVANRIMLTTLLLACSSTQAAEWMSVLHEPRGDEDFVDVSSIKVTGNQRHAWIKSQALPHTTKGVDDGANKWVSTQLSREVFDCGEETRRTEALTTYYEDGTNYSVAETSFPATWRPIRPGTVMAYIMKFVCEWKPK